MPQTKSTSRGERQRRRRASRNGVSDETYAAKATSMVAHLLLPSFLPPSFPPFLLLLSLSLYRCYRCHMLLVLVLLFASGTAHCVGLLFPQQRCQRVGNIPEQLHTSSTVPVQQDTCTAVCIIRDVWTVSREFGVIQYYSMLAGCPECTCMRLCSALRVRIHVPEIPFPTRDEPRVG